MVVAMLALVASLSASAESEPLRADSVSLPVSGTYGLEIGSRQALDTYLSPLPYSGTWLAAYGNWQKALPFDPRHTTMEFDALLGGGRLINRAGTAMELNLDVRFGFGLKWRTTLPTATQVAAGGALDIDGGMLYLTRNGNNPVSAKGNVALSITGAISHPIKIGRLPILLYDEVRIPTIGAFFSPQYGETYYEIYLGNRKGLVHCGWWGNHFRIDNLLGATLDFGRTAMTVGYRFRADTSWVCNLNTHIYTHSFVIGVIPGGIGLKRRSPNAIYSLY